MPGEERRPAWQKMGLSLTGATSRTHPLSLASRRPLTAAEQETLNPPLFEDFLSGERPLQVQDQDRRARPLSSTASESTGRRSAESQ